MPNLLIEIEEPFVGVLKIQPPMHISTISYVVANEKLSEFMGLFDAQKLPHSAQLKFSNGNSYHYNFNGGMGYCFGQRRSKRNSNFI